MGTRRSFAVSLPGYCLRRMEKSMNSRKKPVTKKENTKTTRSPSKDANRRLDIPVDGSESKRIEETLRDERDFAEGIIETAQSIMLVLDTQGRIVRFNPYMELISGYTLTEVQGKDWFVTFLPEGEREETRALFMKAIGDIQTRGNVSSIVTKDGRERQIEWNDKTLKDGQGNILGLLSIGLDITERKQAEEALKESELRYRGLFENSPVSLWEEDFSAVKKHIEKLKQQGVVDFREFFESHPDVLIECVNEVKVIDVNKATLALMRADNKAQLIGNLNKFVRDNIGKDFIDEFVSIAEGKTEFEWEGKNYTLDNQILAVSLHWSAAPGYEDTLEKVLLSLIDITERKRVEKALQESERKISEALEFNRKILNTSSIGILTYKESGQCVSANAAATRVTGGTVAQLMAQNFHEIPSWKKSGMYQAAIKALDTGVEQLLDVHIVTTFGKDSWLSFSFSRFDSAGEQHLLVFAYDITEAKRAEEALRESEERFSRLSTATSEGIGISDQGKLIDANPQLANMLGYDIDELIGSNAIDFVAPESRDLVITNMRAGFEGPYEHLALKKDGSIFPVEIRARMIQFKGRQTRASVIRDITERKQAEKKLEEERILLRTMIDNLPDRVYAMDIQGRKILSNIADWQASGGKAMEDVIGKTDLDTYPPELAKDYWALDKAVIDSGESVLNLEESGLDPQGNLVSVLSSKVPLRDSQGKIIGLVGIGRDITERKQTQTLQEAVYRIAAAAEATSSLDELYPQIHQIISSVMPAEYFYITLYDEAQDLLRFPYFKDAADEPFVDGIQPGKGLSAYVLRTGKSLLCTQAVHDELERKGEVKLLGVPSAIWLGVPLVVEGKTIGAMVVQHYSDPKAYGEREQHMLEFVSTQVAIAINRKRTEEKIHEDEARLHLALEAAKGGAWEWNLQTNGNIWSEELWNVYGLEPHSCVPSYEAWLQTILPDDRAEAEQAVQRAVAEAGELNAEWRVRDRRGRERWLMSRGKPMFNAEGLPVRYIGTVLDITERKQTEDEIRQLNATLEQRVEERTRELREAEEQLVRKEKLATLGQLAGGVGHELRNPLGVINTSVYYLKLVQPDADEKVKQHLAIIEQEIHNSEMIINDLLDFGRVISAEREQGSVDKLVRRTLERFPVPAGVEAALDLPDNLPMVYADPRQMEQVLGNLVTNACQAMNQGGKLTISSRRQKGMVGIAVTDTGKGISPENMKKLFEPLFTTKVKGIGLGLAVSKKLAEANGGRIEAESEAGKGSTFTLYLPIKRKERAKSRK